MTSQAKPHGPTAPATLSSHRAHALSQAFEGQKWLAWFGIAMVLAAMPTLFLMAYDDRLLNGVSVWMKPLKFEISLAVHLFTIAWLMLLLPEGKRRGKVIDGLVVVVVATAFFEMVYIIYQASQGVASHYNSTTPFTRLMYSLMGFAAVSLLVATGGIGAYLLRFGLRGDPLTLAAGIGLVLGSILGTMTGLHLGGQPGHWVGGEATDANGLPLFGWSRTGGDLRVAHFVGLHTIQFLPLFAWLLGGRVSKNLSRVLIYLAACALTAVTGLVFLQAKFGLPLVSL